MYAEYLCAHGFRVHEAATTDDALALIDTCDMVITGLLVPGSIDGVELIARLRAKRSAVPIIVVTANTSHPAVLAASWIVRRTHG